MNKLFLKCVFITLFLLLSNSVIAQALKNEPLTYTQTQDSQQHDDQSQRKLWALSEQDWSRYKALMKGIRGSISPKKISPIEVLGTHARNEAERKKYAGIWARMRHDDIIRILAFQKAYDEAFARLYPDEQMIDSTLLNRPFETQFKPDDRILVFLKIAQCADCVATIQKVMQSEQIKPLHVDIYFVDTHNKKDDDKIRHWAQQHNIDAKRLKSGSITLNHDKGTLYKITKNIVSSVPLVFRLNTKGLIKVVDL